MKEKNNVSVVIGGKEVKNKLVKAAVVICSVALLLFFAYLAAAIMLGANFLLGLALLLTIGTFIVLKRHNNKTATYVLLKRCWKIIKEGW